MSNEIKINDWLIDIAEISEAKAEIEDIFNFQRLFKVISRVPGSQRIDDSDMSPRAML